MSGKKTKTTLAFIVLAFFMVTPQQSAFAQSYPDRPGKIIVPFAAGGPMDIVARFVSQSLEQKLGQPFIVENKGAQAEPSAHAREWRQNLTAIPWFGAHREAWRPPWSSINPRILTQRP